MDLEQGSVNNHAPISPQVISYLRKLTNNAKGDIMGIKNKGIWIFTAALIALEQGIKLIINSSYLQSNTPILPPWLYFNPMFNRDYSWFNSMLQLGVGRLMHIVITALILSLIFVVYKFLNRRTKTSRLTDAAFGFIFAGAICSFIDKVFWNGSLDYILVEGFFTFDLKDVYINTFNGLLVLMLVIDHRGIRTSDDSQVLKDFLKFCRGLIFKSPKQQ